MIASCFPGKSAAVLTNSGTFQINLIVFTKSGSVDPVEHLLALLDNHAVAGKLLLIEGHVDGRHLLVVDGHAALLDQPPGFAVGSAQAAGYSSSMTPILPSENRASGSCVAGIFSLLPLPPNSALAASCALSASASPCTSLVSS